MNSLLRSLVLTLVAASALGSTALPAMAAGPGRPIRAECQSAQDPRACTREHGAAAQAARQGTLTSADTATYQRNALARCESHPPQERKACEDMMLGRGQTTQSGSVDGGGILRETVIQLPPEPAPQ